MFGLLTTSYVGGIIIIICFSFKIITVNQFQVLNSLQHDIKKFVNDKPQLAAKLGVQPNEGRSSIFSEMKANGNYQNSVFRQIPNVTHFFV